MAVAFDTFVTSAQFTTTPDPFTVSYVPSGTPRGILIFGFSMNAGTDVEFDATATYGGVTAARTSPGFAGDTVGEPVAVCCYFLGASVPTGTQTVSVGHSASANPKYVMAVGLTAAADLEVLDAEVLSGAGTNPQVTLDSGATTAIRVFAASSGLNAPGNLTIISGGTAVSSADAGARVWVSGRQTTPGSGSTAVGWTATTASRAMVGVAVAEVAGAVTGRPVRRRRSSWPISLGA